MKNKFNTADIAYFNGNSSSYAWNLQQYQKVIIKDFALDNVGNIYYAVIITDKETSSWYSQNDLLSEKEYRKHKINKINDRINQK